MVIKLIADSVVEDVTATEERTGCFFVIDEELFHKELPLHSIVQLLHSIYGHLSQSKHSVVSTRNWTMGIRYSI